MTAFIDSITQDIYIPQAITKYTEYNATHDLTNNITTAWGSASSFYSETFPSGYNCGSLTYNPYMTSPYTYTLTSISFVV
jgi:hypothetical protein